MDISVYFNDLVAVSSIEIQNADGKEVVQILNEICNYDTIDARYGNENFKLYHKNIEVMDERNEWKEKYKIECQHNDEFKKAYDELTKNFNTLIKNRDEWRDKCNMLEKAYTSTETRCLELLKELEEYKEIASDRDDLKIEIDQLKAQYKSCLENNDILEDAVNEWKDKYDKLVKERDEWRDKCDKLKSES